MLYSYITLDGYKYVVAQNSYFRKWARYFASESSAGFVRLNFVDRGPGVKNYNMKLLLNTWSADSLPYQAGITQTVAQQITNLEASYGKIATALAFLDPLGNPPNIATGVYFTMYTQSFPNHATNQKVYVEADIELVEAAGINV